MLEAKPIFLVECKDFSKHYQVYESMEQISKQLIDYHVLLVENSIIETDFNFRLLSIKNIEEVEFNKLKMMVLDSLNRKE